MTGGEYTGVNLGATAEARSSKEVVMVIIESLLEEYEKADWNKRLCMYLQFRDLRPRFFEKERSIISQELSSHPAQQRVKSDDPCCPDYAIHDKSSRGFWDRLFNVCWPGRLRSLP